jgi:hypothetical protein
MGNNICINIFGNIVDLNSEKLIKLDESYLLHEQLPNDSYCLDMDNTDLSNNKNIHSYNECFPYGIEILK